MTRRLVHAFRLGPWAGRACECAQCAAAQATEAARAARLQLRFERHENQVRIVARDVPGGRIIAFCAPEEAMGIVKAFTEEEDMP